MTAYPSEVLDAARASGRKIPEFFIVGHPKSGTTALYEMLRSHPEIFMPELKETLFFARELHPGLGPADPNPDTLEEYLSLFEPARGEQRAGEASPSYLRSRLAAGRIAEVQPDARIIAIFREPASFLRSLHLQLLQNHIEIEKDLRKAIREEELHGQDKPLQWYGSDRIEYAEQLRRYHDVFGQDRVLALIYDDFRTDNEATLRRVLRFLDVDEAAPVAASEANPTVSVRSPRAYEFVRSLYLGRGPVARVLGAAIKALSTQRMRHGALDATRTRLMYGKAPAPDPELMSELRRRYRHEVVALSEYLDRDLVSLWGYDRPD